MANRHLARSIVLQTLFEWDFNRDQEDFSADEALERNISEFGPGLNEKTFIENLFSLVLKKQKVIDDIIVKAAPEWPLEKINNVDRNILRLGLAELLFGDRDQVPPKVAINESIELAKSFGGDKSSKFINGVLGAVYKEIGEPGKDQKSKKKNDEEIVDIEKLPIEKRGGAVVVSEKDGAWYFGFVHDVFGYWTLVKGSVEENETSEEGTVRQVKRKIGLDTEILELLGNNEYIASHPEKGKIRKQVSYFLAKSDYSEMELSPELGGLDETKWFTVDELENIKTYDDIYPLLARAIQIIIK